MKKYACFLLLFLAIISVSISCERDGGPGKLDLQTYRNLKKFSGSHPRLLLSAEKEEKLRREISAGHQWLWQRYLEDLPEKIARAGENIDRPNRGHGNLAADLAFAWRITGSDSLFEQTKKYLFDLCNKEVWDPEYDLLHGHLLLGVALAYDGLYPRMNRAQRSLVAARLGDEAQMQYERITRQRAWYRNQYLQNHGHVNFGGLAFAGVALYGEDPRAQDWLAACEIFFGRVFELSPPDGTSIEGLSYGNYALEFCLFYAELARQVLGRDYYGSPWLANYPQYLLHSLLPFLAESEWAMTFGDSPRHGNSHGPEPQLFLLASKLNDLEAQWLATRLIRLREHGLGSASWWSLLWYDPDIGESAPAGSQTLKELSDIGQVMIRTSWADTAATMIGIKCGPFMGKTQTAVSSYDLGAAHGHPDAGSFQLYSHGCFLAIDPGYTYFKSAANHNTLLVKGVGQLGGQEHWFAAAEAIRYRHMPRIVESRDSGDHAYVLADLAPSYHPALGLKKALRHFLFLKPDLLLIADQITLDNRGAVFNFPADSLELTGAFRHDQGYVVGTQGQASFTFEGPSGEYAIAASYLDNFPRLLQYPCRQRYCPFLAEQRGGHGHAPGNHRRGQAYQRQQDFFQRTADGQRGQAGQAVSLRFRRPGRAGYPMAVAFRSASRAQALCHPYREFYRRNGSGRVPACSSPPQTRLGKTPGDRGSRFQGNREAGNQAHIHRQLHHHADSSACQKKGRACS